MDAQYLKDMRDDYRTSEGERVMSEEEYKYYKSSYEDTYDPAEYDPYCDYVPDDIYDEFEEPEIINWSKEGF